MGLKVVDRVTAAPYVHISEFNLLILNYAGLFNANQFHQSLLELDGTPLLIPHGVLPKIELDLLDADEVLFDLDTVDEQYRPRVVVEVPVP